MRQPIEKVQDARDRISETIEQGGKFTHNIIGLTLQQVAGKFGKSEANKLVDEFGLTELFGINKVEEVMAETKLKSSQVVMKEGAELVNESTGIVTTIKKEKTIRQFLDVASKKGPIEEERVTIIDDGGKKIYMTIGSTKYFIKKKHCEINAGGVDEKDPLDDDPLEDGAAAKPKTEAELRAEAKAAKKAKKEEIKKLAKEKSGKDDDDDDDDDDKDDAPESGSGKGRDMVKIMEDYVKEANTPEEAIKKLPVKLQSIAKKWVKLKGRMDKYEARWAKRFLRMHKAELKKAYGKDYREKNYGDTLVTLGDL
jgi:hypothetical protein